VEHFSVLRRIGRSVNCPYGVSRGSAEVRRASGTRSRWPPPQRGRFPAAPPASSCRHDQKWPSAAAIEQCECRPWRCVQSQSPGCPRRGDPSASSR
jgi:hypothetical protein